jgi:hypothetical protein
MNLTLRAQVCRLLFLLGVFNFIVFETVKLRLGGDALNGRVIGEHYYLADHSRLTEVSHAVFRYSEIHASSIYLTHPIAVISALVAATARKKPQPSVEQNEK